MPSNVVEMLRRQLREKFPEAHAPRPPREPETPVENLFAPQFFPAGEISEVLAHGSALSLLLAGLLGNPETPAPHPELVWIDGADRFDPASFTPAACSRMLWVRCRRAPDMLKAADLLLRDGNVPFILLDAAALPRAELDSLPKSAWWRLKQTAGRNASRLVVLSSFPLVPCAALRLALDARLTLDDLDLPREELLGKLQRQPQRQSAGA